MDVYSPDVSVLADAIEDRLENGQDVTLPQRFQLEQVKISKFFAGINVFTKARLLLIDRK